MNNTINKTLLTPLQVLALYPSHGYTLDGVLRTRTQVAPDKPFLLFNDKVWTWGTFSAAVERAATMLNARGVHHGDRMAVMASNSDAHVLLMFALERIGAVMVPVNPDFGIAEAQYVMNHAGVCAVACSEKALSTARAACADLQPQPWFMLIDGAADGVPDLFSSVNETAPVKLTYAAKPDDTFILIYSSGTTGFPKGVMHSQRNYVLTGEVQLTRGLLQSDERALCILPLFHVNALFYSLGAVLLAGASLVIAPRFSASGFWQLAADTGATHVGAMMAASSILARRPRSEYVPGHKLRVVNGSGFNNETLAVFKNDFAISTVIEGYGMTEIPAAFGNPYEGPHKLGCMGKPSVHPDTARSWMQVRVVDDEGRDVAAGDSGELIAKVPNIMQGYFHDEEQTKAAYRDGWFCTGDLVRIDADGYFFFVARKKDIIRRRGENIAGAELDRIIGEHPAVSEAAAIGVQAEIGEEEVLVAVVAKAGQALTESDIRDWCRQRLAAHKVPRYVVLASELPHTPTHKVAKHLMKSNAAALRAKAVDFEKSA